MQTAAIDSNALNSLFDNQKKLDDLFDSIFDDDNYYISSSSSSQTESHYSAYDVGRSISPKRSRVTESLLVLKNQSPYFFVLPLLLELAAIYFVVANFW